MHIIGLHPAHLTSWRPPGLYNFFSQLSKAEMDWILTRSKLLPVEAIPFPPSPPTLKIEQGAMTPSFLG